MLDNVGSFSYRKARFFLALLSYLALISLPEQADGKESPLRLEGYMKHFFLVETPAEIKGLPLPTAELHTEGIVLNRGRFKLTWIPSNVFTGECAYDLVPRVAETEASPLSVFLPRPQPRSYRAFDFREKVSLGDKVKEGNFSLGQNLDRLFIVFSPAIADIYIGRQPVAFGSARALNPTDVLAPFTFEELDKEERVGVDAWRIKIPAGMMGEIDVGMVFGEDFDGDESAAFLRTRLYLWETDITFLGIAFKENMLGGIDLARAIGGAGFWLEAAYTFAGALNHYIPEESYFRFTTGLDYNFSKGIYAFVEYHFSSAGRDDPERYPFQFHKTAYQEGGVYLLGRHYLIPGIVCEITPLWIFTEQMVFNVVDPSVYLSARLEYSLTQDVFIQFGIFSALGKGARINLTKGSDLEIVNPGSEFGLYPTMYFASIRLYF